MPTRFFDLKKPGCDVVGGSFTGSPNHSLEVGQRAGQREHQADILNSGKKLKDGAKIRKSRNSEKAGLGFAAAWDPHEGTRWIPPPEVQPG